MKPLILAALLLTSTATQAADFREIVSRDQLAVEYCKLQNKIHPNYNDIQCSVQKYKNGYAIVAKHRFFSRYEYDIGPASQMTEDWIYSIGIKQFKNLNVLVTKVVYEHGRKGKSLN